MKLSDVKGERTLDVIAEIIDPIANIAEDEAAKEMFKRTETESMLKKIRKGLPALIRGHKDDIITVLAAVAGVDKTVYCESMTLAKLITDCMELVSDETFLDFFSSSVKSAGNA